MIKSYKTQGATSFGVAPSFLISLFGLLKLTIRYALVCVDAFYYILMVVVGGGLYQVKTAEFLAINTTDNSMYRLRQIQQSHTAVSIAICQPGLRAPVRNNMQTHQRLRTIRHPTLLSLPLYRAKLYEHRRAVPHILLLQELHIMIPQIHMLYPQPMLRGKQYGFQSFVNNLSSISSL